MSYTCESSMELQSDAQSTKSLLEGDNRPSQGKGRVSPILSDLQIDGNPIKSVSFETRTSAWSGGHDRPRDLPGTPALLHLGKLFCGGACGHMWPSVQPIASIREDTQP